MNGPPPPFRPYSEEWPEHFALCFEELGVNGNAQAAYEYVRDRIAEGVAFSESRQVVDAIRRRYPVALLSNADDDFLLPCLARNGFSFPAVISSEAARAYKPHVAIFEKTSEAMGIGREHILYVGDSRFADVAGAKNAGMYAAWVKRPRVDRPIEASQPKDDGRPPPPPLPDPDFEIDSLEGLYGILGL